MNSRFTPLGNICIIVLLAGGVALVALPHLRTQLASDTAISTQLPSVIVESLTKPSTITLGFVGDIMIHTPMANSARTSDGAYEFDQMFTQIKELTIQPDIMVGNLETPVTGDSTISGYPNFDAPLEVLESLSTSGFDILQVANNHSLDQKPLGLEATLRNIESNGMLPVGGSLFPSMAYSPLVLSHDGITVALIAATFGFNGYALPEDKSHLANLIDIDKIQASIASARTQGADIVIVLPHFGVEYQRKPSYEQKALVDALVLAGADAIIGSHPHVVQTTERRTGPTGKEVYIAYSLGNFISNQQDLYTDLGLMSSLTYSKDPTTGLVTLSEVSETPLYTHKYRDEVKRHFEVVPLAGALASERLAPDDIQRIQDYNKVMNTQFESAEPVEPPPTLSVIPVP
jgi:hypothetical protein